MQKKRLGIFVFYDKDGIVDDYVPYLLNDIGTILERLVIVVNGKVSAEGYEKLKRFSEEILIRDNKGFDVAAWRDALCTYIGWETVCSYDELVLFNDTFYGPFIPFSSIFSSMNSPDIDFWGLSAHGATADFPVHIQSYFTVFTSQVIKDQKFQAYWKKTPTSTTVHKVIATHEVLFTDYLASLGFKWKAYTDFSHLDSPGTAINHYEANSHVLLRKGFPILKKKSFSKVVEYLALTDSSHVRLSLEYIQSHYTYPLSLIYQNIIRILEPIHLMQALNTVYVESSTCIKSMSSEQDTIVVMYVYYDDHIPYVASYIKHIPQDITVFVAVVSKTIKEHLLAEVDRVILIKVVENRGRDLAAFLVDVAPVIRQYQFACFVHDKKSPQESALSEVTIQDLLWKNMLGSTSYINSVLQRFQNEPFLGVLAPPVPLSGPFFGPGFCFRWGDNYKQMESLFHTIGINYSVPRESEPLTLGTALWFRVSALEPLLSYPWKREDFPPEPFPIDGTISHALERSFGFIAQAQGFYTGWTMTEEYASNYINNMHYMLADTYRRTCKSSEFNGHYGNMSYQLSRKVKYSFYGIRQKIVKIVKRCIRLLLPHTIHTKLKRWWKNRH